MTIAELQRHARELADVHGWQDTTPERRALWLVTEVGELARDVLQFPSAGEEAARTTARQHLGAEMYDVVWNICDLANMMGVELETSFSNKEAVNREREWPSLSDGSRT